MVKQRMEVQILRLKEAIVIANMLWESKEDLTRQTYLKALK